MPAGRAVYKASRWTEGDGEGDPKAPGLKFYDEPCQRNDKDYIMNWPPVYNDLSCAWVARIIAEGKWTAYQCSLRYPATFTCHSFVNQWKCKGEAAKIQCDNGVWYYQIVLGNWQMSGKEGRLNKIPGEISENVTFNAKLQIGDECVSQEEQGAYDWNDNMSDISDDEEDTVPAPPNKRPAPSAKKLPEYPVQMIEKPIGASTYVASSNAPIPPKGIVTSALKKPAPVTQMQPDEKPIQTGKSQSHPSKSSRQEEETGRPISHPNKKLRQEDPTCKATSHPERKGNWEEQDEDKPRQDEQDDDNPFRALSPFSDIEEETGAGEISSVNKVSLECLGKKLT